MKISIMDLMDYYYGEEGAQLAAKQARHTAAPSAPAQKSPALRPLRIAAAFLLVVGISGALIWGFGSKHGAGNSLGQEPTPEPTAVATAPPESSSEEAARTTHAPDAVAYPQQSEVPNSTDEAAALHADSVLDCAADSTDYYSYGNLILADGSYYTMTQNGIVPLTTTHLETTVDLYGSWTVDLDYAVVDGQLVFHNNTSTNRYVLVDGEPMGEMDYYEKYGTYPTDVIEPQVAVAEPVPGSADTVQLWIYRHDSQASGLRYPFFYNIFTGEVSDPLANVPELLNHTFFGGFIFNSALTKVLVPISTALSVGPDDAIIPGSRTVYVCDLVTGTMTDAWSLLESDLPNTDDPDTNLSMSGSCTWADDDTFLCWITTITVKDDDTQISTSAYAYSLSDQALVYRSADSGSCVESYAFNQSQIYESLENRTSAALQLRDTASGTTYSTGSIAPDLGIRKLSGNMSLLTAGDGTIYLVDEQHASWANLTEQLALPKDGVQSYPLLTEDWLCVSTRAHVYCYELSKLTFTPLEAD